MVSSIGVDNKLLALQDLKTSNHNDLASIDSKVGDLAGFKTQNHTDLDALNTSFTQLANWLKKKLAYSFDYDFISKQYVVDGSSITLDDLEVGKSYFVRIYCQDADTLPSHDDVLLPVGDYLIYSLTNNFDNVGDKSLKDFFFSSLKLYSSKSGNPYALRAFDSGDIGEYYYFILHRCSDSVQY